MLTLSQRDRDRLAVLKQVEQGLVATRRGAELLGITSRHFRRLRRRWERAGDGVVIHGLRGRRSNRAKASQMRGRALKRAREPVFEGFGPTLLAEHLSRDAEIGVKSRVVCKSGGSSSMLLLGCLGDLLRFEKREIQVATFAPDRSSP